MAEVHIGAGAVIDLATADDLAKDRKTLLDAVTGGRDPHPLRFTQQGQRLGQSSDPIDLGGPPVGRIWFIRGFTVTGKDPWESVAGGALIALCIGNVGSFQLSHVRIPAITIPQYRVTSDDGLWCHANENVYALTTLLGTTQQIMVSVQAEEWNTVDVTMNNPGYSPIA